MLDPLHLVVGYVQAAAERHLQRRQLEIVRTQFRPQFAAAGRSETLGPQVAHRIDLHGLRAERRGAVQRRPQRQAERFEHQAELEVGHVQLMTATRCK